MSNKQIHTRTQGPRVKQKKLYNISNIQKLIGNKDKQNRHTLRNEEKKSNTQQQPLYKPIQNLKKHSLQE